MGVSRSGFYSWKHRAPKVIDMNEFRLARRAKSLFLESRRSLGSRQLTEKLREEGFKVGRYKVRNLMRRLGYKITTKRKHSHAVAPNIVEQKFNVALPNQVWAGDVTYLKTREGWVYLAIVMDLYSRRIVGFSMSKHMKTTILRRGRKH